MVYHVYASVCAQFVNCPTVQTNTIYYNNLNVEGKSNEIRNFIFANSIKRHICDVENSRLRHYLPISVNGRVISPFRVDFIFTKLRINPRENNT